MDAVADLHRILVDHAARCGRPPHWGYGLPKTQILTLIGRLEAEGIMDKDRRRQVADRRAANAATSRPARRGRRGRR